MALPSRKELTKRIDRLEAELVKVAVYGGLGYVGGKLVPVATVGRTAAQLSPIGGALLLADLAIREEQSLLWRGGAAAQPYASGALERLRDLEMPRDAQFGSKGLAYSPAIPLTLPKKKKSSFNKAVSVGMKAVKASTSYGPKGEIRGAKKAFSAVTKIASKIRRGLKVSKTGVSGIIGRAVRQVIKAPKKAKKVKRYQGGR